MSEVHMQANENVDNPLPSPEEFSVLSQVIRDVARRGRLSADDAQDFAQTVHLRLLERRYDVFLRFSGLSSLRTFLTVVVRRMLLDWRRTQYGTWRASQAARRLGPAAIALDTLISRDGYTVDEAIETLRTRAIPDTPSQLRRLAVALPTHQPRRPVGVDAIDSFMSMGFEDPIQQLDSAREAMAVKRRLATALKQLAADDRRLLDLRYRQAQRVPAIARRLRTDCKGMYRRCDKVLRSLRNALDATA